MARRETTIKATLDLDISKAQQQMQTLSRTTVPVRGGAGGGGGGGASPTDTGWRTGFGAGVALQRGPFAGFGVGGFAVNTAMFAAAGALGNIIREIPQFVAGMAEMNVSLQRTSTSGRILSQSLSEANFDELTQQYSAMMRGYVTEGEAAARVTQLLALGYAGSTQEMMGFVRATRAAQLSTGRTAESIEQNLILALANADQSVGRIDQLGISMEELNTRVDELRSSGEATSLGEARRIAILEILNDRYTDLAASGELAASGLEALSSSMRQLAETLAEGGIGQFFDNLFVRLSQMAGSPDIGTQMRVTDFEALAQRTFGLTTFNQQPSVDQVAAVRNLAERMMEMQMRAEETGSPLARSVIDSLGELFENWTLGQHGIGHVQSQVEQFDQIIRNFERVAEAEAARAESQPRETVLGPAMESSLKSMVGKIENQAVQLMAEGFDPATVAQGFKTTIDDITAAAHSYQAMVDAGFATEDEARFAFIDSTQMILDANQDQLDLLADAARSAAQELSGLVGGVIGAARGLAANILGMGGDSGFVIRELEKVANNTGSQIEALVELRNQGQISDEELFVRAEQVKNAQTQTLQVEADALKEAQRIRKGTDRTNEILRDQQDIWNKFIGRFEKIPGVLSATEPTEHEMALAEAGLYRDRPDEWLRRLRDEVLNGVDYENIDPGAIFGRLGMALPGERGAQEAQLARITEMFNTGELFNFFMPGEILDAKVIEQEMARVQRELEGSKRREQWLAAMFGTEEEVRAGAVLGILDPITFAWDQALTDMTGMAQQSEIGADLVSNIVAQIEDGRINEALKRQFLMEQEEVYDKTGGPIITYDNQTSGARGGP